MGYKIEIPYLQIGEFRVETPHGLSELLENAWVNEKDAKNIDEFISKYERTVYRNEEGRLVTRYSLGRSKTNKEGA